MKLLSLNSDSLPLKLCYKMHIYGCSISGGLDFSLYLVTNILETYFCVGYSLKFYSSQRLDFLFEIDFWGDFTTGEFLGVDFFLFCFALTSCFMTISDSGTTLFGDNFLITFGFWVGYFAVVGYLAYTDGFDLVLDLIDWLKFNLDGIEKLRSIILFLEKRCLGSCSTAGTTGFTVVSCYIFLPS